MPRHVPLTSSAHPAFTIKRAVLLVLLTTTAIAIGAGSRSLEKTHTALFIVLVGVVALDLASALLWPELAFEDIGLKGIHSQKNVAGMIGMIAIIDNFLAKRVAAREIQKKEMLEELEMIRKRIVFAKLEKNGLGRRISSARGPSEYCLHKFDDSEQEIYLLEDRREQLRKKLDLK